MPAESPNAEALIQCPFCAGTGTLTAESGTFVKKSQTYGCRTCEGTGRISRSTYAATEVHRQAAEKRLHRGCLIGFICVVLVLVVPGLVLLLAMN